MPDSDGVARMDERLKTLSDDVVDLKRELYGNGNRGLKTAITELRQAFRLGTWIAGIIAGALILDLSSRMIALASDGSHARGQSTEAMPRWLRDATSPRNDPRAAEIRALERRFEELKAKGGATGD